VAMQRKREQVGCTCTKLTVPSDVLTGCSCASSAINMCWIRDSLPSRERRHGMWSPGHRLLPDIILLISALMQCVFSEIFSLSFSFCQANYKFKFLSVLGSRSGHSFCCIGENYENHNCRHIHYDAH